MVLFIVIFIVICLIVATYLFLIAPAYNARDCFSQGLASPYAHRGLHGGPDPENSMGAFKNAVEYGCGIELDVRLSSDGEVVVFHDDNLKRICGFDRAVNTLTAAQLSRVPLNGTEYTVPRLKDVLRLVDGAVPLLIELKGEDKNAELCDKLFPLLDNYSGAFCIESFNPLLLKHVREHRPAFIRGQLVDILTKDSYKGSSIVRFMLSHLLLNVLSRPHFIAYNYKKKPSLGIWICENIFGARRFAWTVKDKGTFSELKKNTVTSIFEGFLPY